MIEEYELIMIGAGPTGLGAAWRALERNHDDFLILESTQSAWRIVGF